MSEPSAELTPGSQHSWRMVRQWPHFVASTAAAVSCFVASCYLLRWGHGPLLPTLAFSAIAAVLVFDGCWLAALFGATWAGALRSLLSRRFWHYAFAWILIDLLFLGAVYALIRLLEAIDMQAHEQPLIGAIVIALVPWASFFALVTLRARLALWPIHVFATGRLLDIETPWNRTGKGSGTSADRSMAALCLGLLGVLIVGTIVFILAPSQAIDAGPIAIPAALLLVAAIFRALQLSAFVARYRTQAASS